MAAHTVSQCLAAFQAGKVHHKVHLAHARPLNQRLLKQLRLQRIDQPINGVTEA